MAHMGWSPRHRVCPSLEEWKGKIGWKFHGAAVKSRPLDVYRATWLDLKNGVLCSSKKSKPLPPHHMEESPRSWAKEARHEGGPTVWFHLDEVQEQAELMGGNKLEECLWQKGEGIVHWLGRDTRKPFWGAQNVLYFLSQWWLHTCTYREKNQVYA